MRPFSAVESPFIAAEGAGWLVVFKPAGMDSVPAGGNSSGTVAEWIRLNAMPEAAAPELKGSRMEREMGMMSRLDRDTSGLILCARTPETFRAFTLYQSQGLLAKRYRLTCTWSGLPMEGSRPALYEIHGESGLPAAGMRIESFFRSFGERARKVACVHPDSVSGFKGRLSGGTYVTELLAVLPAGDRKGSPQAVILDAGIRRGFRHQIRAHMSWAGWPIDGDELYGGRPSSRLQLESCGISFPDESGHIIEIELYGKVA